jgi:hypothetical protein
MVELGLQDLGPARGPADLRSRGARSRRCWARGFSGPSSKALAARAPAARRGSRQGRAAARALARRVWPTVRDGDPLLFGVVPAFAGLMLWFGVLVLPACLPAGAAMVLTGVVCVLWTVWARVRSVFRIRPRGNRP